MKKPRIGFIGQGFIGKSYADDFEARGYEVVRYSPRQFPENRERIKTCNIVFIAVPTPSTPKGFDYSIVKSVLKLVGKGNIAVIKSTVLPGTTRTLQKKFPAIVVMHSPEFLVLKTAAYDAKHPHRNIVGYVRSKDVIKAKQVLKTLPRAPYSLICKAEDAELVKYGGNFFLYVKVLYANLLYEVARAVGADYELVRQAVAADPRIGPSHMQVLHDSGHKGAKRGRGAGGVCFIKDVAALKEMYSKQVKDKYGLALLEALIEKNLDLLVKSGKDLELIEGVHGKAAIVRHRKK